MLVFGLALLDLRLLPQTLLLLLRILHQVFHHFLQLFYLLFLLVFLDYFRQCYLELLHFGDHLIFVLLVLVYLFDLVLYFVWDIRRVNVNFIPVLSFSMSFSCSPSASFWTSSLISSCSVSYWVGRWLSSGVSSGSFSASFSSTVPSFNSSSKTELLCDIFKLVKKNF